MDGRYLVKGKKLRLGKTQYVFVQLPWRLTSQSGNLPCSLQFAIHSFIDTLCGRLSNAALSSRAKMIFDQAMTRGHYRWGRKAKLIAGASAAAALREVQKSDSLRDIAVSISSLPQMSIRPTHPIVDPSSI